MTSELKEQLPVGVVFYTDGGCRGGRNPGFAGWGMHGYLFINEVSKKPLGVPDNFITAKGYVRKAAADNSNPEIVAERGKNDVVEVTPLRYVEAYGSFKELTSNNVAELMGAIRALQYVQDQKAQFNIVSVQIFSDSEYTCKGLEEWVDGWRNNGWLKADGNPPANVQYWKQLITLRDNLVKEGVEVSIDWIKAHNGDLGNEAADRLATLGVMGSYAELHIEKIIESDVAGFWKYNVDKHPMIANRRLYFNTQTGFNTPGVYYLGEHGKDDDLIGKRMVDGAYSVVRLEKPDPVIELVRDYQNSLAGELDTLVMIRLDKLFRPDTHRDLAEHGTLAVSRPSPVRLDLHCHDREPLTRELRPPRLAMRAVEAVSDLIIRLDNFLAEDNDVTATDLTALFYDIEVKDKKGVQTKEYKLKAEFGVGASSLKVDANYRTNTGEIKQIPITLTFGLDILDRNGMKRLEDGEPRVNLITWREADEAIRFATVIETTTGTGIWCGYYSNLVFLKN